MKIINNFITLLLLILFLWVNTLSAKNYDLIEDLEYASSAKNKIDIYLPKKNLNKKVIFMVHGGAWRIGDKSSRAVVFNKVKHWVSKGYIFISVNYRMLPEADVFTQAKDIAYALKFSQNYLKKYNINEKDFILMGHSAGAHLVSLISSNPNIAYKYGVKPWLATISIDTASFDIVETMENKHARFYDKAFGKDISFWKRVSPYHQIKSKIVPFLAICSTKREVSCKEAIKYVNKLKSFNSNAKVLRIDLNHRNINKKLGLNSDYTKKVDSFFNKIK